MPKGVYTRTKSMRTGKYTRTEAMKNQCRLNASKTGGFHGIHTDETKEKMRAKKLANPTKYWLGKTRGSPSVETRQKMHDAKIASGFVPSLEARRLAALALHNGPTSIELFVSAFLTRIGISHFNQFEIGKYICDVVVPSWNLVIECDGTFLA